jgi:hypothetical protein
VNIFKNWSLKADENDKDKNSLKGDDNLQESDNFNSEETSNDVMKVLESVSNMITEKRKEKGILGKFIESDKNNEKLDKEIKERLENKKTNNISLMFKEAKLFTEHSQDLKGLYESFYQIKEGKYKNKMVILILDEYRGRIINIPELKEIGQFFSYVDYLKENEMNINEVFTFVEWWLSYLKLCGITRDDKLGELVVFNGIGRYYNEEDDEELLIDDKALIVKPYWKQNDIVLEKGIVKKLSKGE